MAERTPETMRAMVLDEPRKPLRETSLAVPVPTDEQMLIRVHACGVCRTDLHLLDGEVKAGHSPVVLGHQIVGTDVASGARVGVPWLGWTDGTCRWCTSGRENLCVQARFTGADIDGGYAQYAVADRRYCLALPESYSDDQVAPLLCAGLIGFRALRMTGDAERLGLYGFGSSAHIICQVAVHQGRRVFAFTRGDDTDTQAFARELGAEWAGDSLGPAPEPLDAAIIFAPAGELVPAALRATDRGGVVVCAGIHMSDIPSFPYSELWEERVVRSVANLTREDGVEFLKLAPQVPVKTDVTVLLFTEANEALRRLRGGELRGSIVLDVAGA